MFAFVEIALLFFVLGPVGKGLCIPFELVAFVFSRGRRKASVATFVALVARLIVMSVS